MPDSIRGYLPQDLVCEGLLECVHGLKTLDRVVYRAADAEGVADEMQRLVTDWLAQMAQLIHEFRETYGTQSERLLPAH
jgi:predicted transcriptional regulator